LAESKKSQNASDFNNINHLQVVFCGYHNRGDPWQEQRYSND